MGIQARIVSRKIWIMSLYEQLAAQQAQEQSNNYDFQLFEDVSLTMVQMVYMAERFFTNEDKTKEQITDMVDVGFLKPMIQQWKTYYPAVIAAVNNNSTSFGFEKMDPIDKAIFLGGGVEYLVHKTPLKIIMNEMIEIAKRYGDEGAPKLINGIGHKVMEELTVE
ncbi:transcription antitermination protein NusB [candidate division SR1 bacterium Aalborg_AAW-1]|nr:transcription antitermination protein NusB [candidate division SR1 bacterium Aalborg_AAW-1]